MRKVVTGGLVTGLMLAGMFCDGADPRPGAAAQRGARLCDRVQAHPRPEGAPKHSDVSMRLFRESKDGREFEMGKAFHITRADWCYIYGSKDKAAYIRKAKAHGWAFQGAMNAVTHNPEHAMKLRDGKPMRDHFNQEGRYWADMNNEDYRLWYVEQMKQWIDLGADSIQRDEPLTIGKTPVATAVKFFQDVHARFEKLVGRKVPISCNMKRGFAYGGREPVNRLFDFGMAEFYRHDLNPVLIGDAARDAARRGKSLVYTGGAPLTHQEIRVAIAGCYANGINYIVPWDQFTGIKIPRLFAKPEDLADLYGFVRANAPYLDDYMAAEAHIPVALRPKDVRHSLANELFAGRAFTVVMVSRSTDGGFGVGGNGENGGGGIPRLYMTRSGFSYNVLDQAAIRGTAAAAVEITTFVHDGTNGIAVYLNGEKAGRLTGQNWKPQGSFGSGGHLSIPFNGGNRNHPGDLSELLGFRGELAADDWEALHGALKQKYLDESAQDAAIPAELQGPDLLVHLVADDLAKTHTDGAAVTRWPARTGQVGIVPKARLFNGKEAAPPTFRAGAMNGHAVVQFDGVDDLMRLVATGAESDASCIAVQDGTGSGRLCVFARAKPGDPDAPVVLHLVEWLGRPKPATLILQPEAFFGERKMRATLMTPVAYDKALHERAADRKTYADLARATELDVTTKDGLVRIDVPALTPWGLLVISRSGQGQALSAR